MALASFDQVIPQIANAASNTLKIISLSMNIVVVRAPPVSRGADDRRGGGYVNSL